MGLIERYRNRGQADTQERFSLEGLAQQIQYLGNSYPIGLQQTLVGGDSEPPDRSFTAFTRAAYETGGPVFACILARGLLFSEARFLWQQLDNGRPGELFRTAALRLLEQPWPSGTTGELLWRAEQDVSLAGNFFVRRMDGRLWRLRPDWVSIVLGSRMDVDHPNLAIDAEVLGYVWGPPEAKKEDKVALMPSEVAHWSPIPDPLSSYRGMSWITPIMREVQADRGATVHKERFFSNGATPNMVVTADATVDITEFSEFIELFQDKYEGAMNAYKTLFLGGGSSVQMVGSSMKDMDYKAIQGIGETRIAAAAGVPPIIAGFSEGLSSATYSNYSMARRKFGDHWARPQWRSFCAAMQKLLPKPQGGPSRLWYDDRDVAFLREDMGDEAEIRQKSAATVRTLVEGGWDPDAAVAYASSGNLTELAGQHSGRVSVQLLPVDEAGTIEDAEPSEQE